MDNKLEIEIAKRLAEQGHLDKAPKTFEQAIDYLNAEQDVAMAVWSEELNRIISCNQLTQKRLF